MFLRKTEDLEKTHIRFLVKARSKELRNFSKVYFSQAQALAQNLQSHFIQSQNYITVFKKQYYTNTKLCCLAGTAPLQLVKLELAIAQSSTGIANFYRKEAAKPRILNSDV